MNKTFFSKVSAKLGSFFALILGQFSWNSPPWMKNLRNEANKRPAVFWGTFFSILVLFVLSGYVYHWYKHLPRPKLITAQITAPQITPVAKVLVPDTVTIDFGLNDNGLTSKSVAPLKMIGKEVTKGITLTPTMAGKWTWQNDSRLIFKPSEDWPAGQEYTIHFEKNVFAPGTKMESFTYTFSTQPFKASVAEFKLYQDPIKPQVREAVATINFNFPVNGKSFESNTHLLLQALKKGKLDLTAQSFKFTVSYDEHNRTAYLHSEPLPMPKVPRYLELVLDKGIKPLTGMAKTTQPVAQNLLIPDASSYFKISETTASIVRNEQDKPEQVLAVETTLGVKEAELNQSLHVYLLPQDYPATAVEEAKTNYEWKNPGEVTPDILKLSNPLPLQAIPADRDYATLHSYKFNANTPRYIYLKIDKGVHGFGDFVLADDYAAVIKVPEYPKEIGFLHKGSLLALSGEKKISVIVRGVPAVKFQIARVLPDDVNHLITQTSGKFSDPQFTNYSFNQQNISDIFSEILQFDTSDLSKGQYTSLDLGKYLSTNTNAGGPQGLFLLQATGWDPNKKVPLNVKNSRLILITDLGLVVKDNKDGTHDVFVQSITKGTPLADVAVSILGKNGVPILTRNTNEQGQAHFPSLTDFTDEREPTVYLTKLGNDVGFIPYNNYDRQLNYSRFEIGGVVSNQEIQSLTAYLFSDRGIYRPGDLAHVGMIVKQAYAKAQPAGLPLEAIITDPRGTTVLDQKFNLDATGYSTLDFKTDATAPTGQYTVNLYIVKDNHPGSLLGSTHLRVSEFQPDRMRIVSHLSKEQATGWVSPTDLSAKVSLWNLYGAPAANRKISAKILLAPHRVQFKEYPEYTFVDPLFDPNKPPKVFTDTLPDVNTNDQGQAQFDLNLGRFDKATYQLTFFAEGFEAEGGRSVTTQSTALVSPLAYFIGYKPDGDLNYITQNTQRGVNFIAINPQLKQQSVNNLKLQIASLHPVTTLVKNLDGTYQYQSLIQTSVISTEPFTVDEAGSNYALPAQQVGNFAVTILDQNNTELSRFKYSVVGTSQLPLAKNAELSIKLNKAEYLPDEDIELQITAPYTGAGLITIERDKVYAAQWFKTDATNSVQKIHLPKDFEGNGYVNVAFVRDWNSPDIFISPLSFNVVPFSVNHEDHDIHIELMTPEVARPGEPFSISYKSNKPGKIIVFAIDEGILQVAHYKTPDPLGFFFQKYALEVITQQTVDLILPKFIQERELSAVGGGAGAEELRLNLNPFKRKTEAPVAYWSGIVDTDSTPRELIYQVPDYFNGTLRVMAVAVAADAVGSAEKGSQIRGNFVINPNIPTFVAPSDEFEITASVAKNVKNSGPQAKVDVQLNVTPQLEIIGITQQTLTISEGQEQTVRFKLRAKSLLGSAQLTFTASIGDKLSKITETLSVRPANPFLTTVMSGMSSDVNQSIIPDRKLYPEYRNVDAVMSTSPLILVYGLQRYLDNFPFGCTEQLVSKAFPLLALSNQPWFTEDPSKVTEKIDATVRMLNQRQMSSGAISYWPGLGENENNVFDTVYALHFLTEAKLHGYTVPNNLLQSGINYLKDLAGEDVTSLDQARIHAYAIYILTRNEIVTTNYLTNLQLYLDKDPKHAWQQDIISAYIAATYQLLKSYSDADRLIDYYKPQINSTNPTNDFYNSQIADAQYLYLVAKHFPDRLAKVGKDLVMPLVTAMNKDEINTVFSSYTSLAFSAYAQSYQTTSPATFSIVETLNNGQTKTLPAADSTFLKVSVDDLVKQITFNNPGKTNYFYQLTQAGFDKNLPTDILKQGLEIYREYRDVIGNVLTKTNLGNEIEVHIQVRALEDRYLNNVAVVDLLPGGFEVVNDSVKATNMDYADAREDRVIFFGSVGPDTKEIVYRIKAINVGQYLVPPIMASSMYDLKIKARGVGGKMAIVEGDQK